MRMLFNPSQADPPSQVEVQVPGGVAPQGDMDRVMAFSEGLVEGWSLGGRKIADWYPGFPRGERVRYVGCHFDGLAVESWMCQDVEFVDCEFTNLRVKKWVFERAAMRGCRVQGTAKDVLWWGESSAVGGGAGVIDGNDLTELKFSGPCSQRAGLAVVGNRFAHSAFVTDDRAAIVKAAEKLLAVADGLAEGDAARCEQALRFAREDLATGQSEWFFPEQSGRQAGWSRQMVELLRRAAESRQSPASRAAARR